ncbi:MAG: efflux RND transporter periplasmic adaptor subunit [Acidobacteriota bacterium]|jgi:RND family efflux transporter MFP subunit
MSWRSGFTRALILLVIAGVVAGTAILRPSLLPHSLGSLLSSGHDHVDELTVLPKSLSFGVDATGILRATSVQYFGAPPEFGSYWEFQIVSMAAEGKTVKKGESLISFDAQKVREDLQRFQNELEQAAKELERTRDQIDLENQELSAKLADVENRYQKMRLKQEGISPDLQAFRDIELDRLSVEQARREVEALKDRIRWHQSSSDATVKIIASKKARAENQVEEIKRGMEGFEVKSDRDGILVYKLKWNNNRYQVGETCYSGQPLMEIPDLNTILVEANVPEVDIGKVKPGQHVEVSIDALPGSSFPGAVKSVGTLVRTKSWDVPNKVLEVLISLEHVDPATMRPSMTIRARIETAAYSDVLAIPLSAVRTVAGKVVVRVREGTQWRDRSVELGESNGTEVIVRQGLQPGDRIATDYIKTSTGSAK